MRIPIAIVVSIVAEAATGAPSPARRGNEQPAGCRPKTVVVDQKEYDLQGSAESPLLCSKGIGPVGSWRLHASHGGDVFHVNWSATEMYGLRLVSPPNEVLEIGPFRVRLMLDEKGVPSQTQCLRTIPYKAIVQFGTGSVNLRQSAKKAIGDFTAAASNCAKLENIGHCSDLPDFICVINFWKRVK